MDSETIRIVTLVTLVIQNAGQSFALTQSRMPNSQGKTYNASLAIFVQELLKIAISFMCLLCVLYRRETSQYESLPIAADDKSIRRNGSTSLRDLLVAMKKEVITNDFLKMMVPASLYVAQNHLQLVGASNCDATNFAVLSQMKIITTAIFTVTLLRRILTRKQWCSVFALFLGVVLVQVSPDSVSKSFSPVTKAGVKALVQQSSLKGMLALLGACFLSGFAGVYTEKVLSRSTSSIFASTLQMAMCSVLPAAMPILMMGVKAVLEPETSEESLFANFGARAWLGVLYSVWGGFTVAVTMKVSTSMAKSFATSIAIVLTLLVSIVVLHNPITPLRLLGAIIVIISAYTYSVSAAAPASPATNAGTVSPVIMDEKYTPARLDSDPSESASESSNREGGP